MYKRILVAVDGSETSARALQEAVDVARDSHAQMRLLYVIDLRPLILSGSTTINFDDLLTTWQADAEEIVARMATVPRAAGLPTEIAVLQTNIQHTGDVILGDAEKWHADLLVLGTHGRHGLGRMLLGSVAEHVARGATVPVLLTRGDRVVRERTAPAQENQPATVAP